MDDDEVDDDDAEEDAEAEHEQELRDVVLVDQLSELAEAAAVQPVEVVDAPPMVVAVADLLPTTVGALGVVQDDLTALTISEPPTCRSSTFAIAPMPSWCQRVARHVECGHCRTYSDEHPAGLVPPSASWT